MVTGSSVARLSCTDAQATPDPVRTLGGYRNGFVARCAAEDLALLRLLQHTVRETALEPRGR